MSGRSRARGTVSHGRQGAEDVGLAGGDFQTPDKANEEEEPVTEIERGSRSSTRENRLKRRKDQRGKEDELYERVLQASGIDIEGMDLDEREQLAQVLLQSKSEAEGSNQSWGNVEVTQARPESCASLASSTDSVLFLQQNTLKEDPLSFNSQDLAEFEDKDTQPEGDSPLNCSMSQIFSQGASDDEETQPPSPVGVEASQGPQQTQRGQQTHRKIQTRGEQPPIRAPLRRGAQPEENTLSSKRAPLTDITHSKTRGEPVILDCHTLEEDVVDGDFPSNSNHGITHDHSDPKDSEPMLLEQIPPAKYLKVTEVTVGSRSRDSKISSQESDEPLTVEPSKQRKRKASCESEGTNKLSRLDEEMQSFSIGSYFLEGENPQQTKSRPLKRRYRKQRRMNKGKKFYSLSQSREDCNQYTSVILQLLDVYRTELKDAQCECLGHVTWGDPVRPGRHMSRTIDMKHRGQDSCYWEDLSELEDEDEGTEVQQPGKSTDERSTVGQTKENESENQLVSIGNISDDDDFIPVEQKATLPLRKTRSNPEENKAFSESKWLSTRRNIPTKTDRKTRKKAITKPELDFVSEADHIDNFKINKKWKETDIFGKNMKTYSRKGPVSRQDSSELEDVQESQEEEVLTLSPVCQTLKDDDITNENEGEASIFKPESPLFYKPSSSDGKKSAFKIFTFASTDSGKIKVSEKISQEDENDFLQTSPKFSKTFSRTRKKNEIQETSSKGDYSNSVEEISISGDLDEEITFGKKMAPKTRTGDSKSRNKPKVTAIKIDEEADFLLDNVVKTKTKKKNVARQLDLDKKEQGNLSGEKASVLDLAEGQEGCQHGDDAENNDIMSTEEVVIPSSVVFSGKKRKLSNLFSDNDESFTLGVSPSKAFSAVFENLSDELPDASGAEVKFQGTTSSQTKTKSLELGAQINLVRPSIHAYRKDNTEEINHQPDSQRPETSSKSKPLKTRKKRSGQGLATKRTDFESVQNVLRTEPVDVVEGVGEVAPDPTDFEADDAIACPLCGQEFSVKLIETHAANCHGDPTDNDDAGAADRGWRVAVETGDDPHEGDKEKCYICDKLFQRGGNYERHVDECLAVAKRQQEELEKSFGGRRSRATRARRHIEEQSGSDEDVVPHGNQKVSNKKRKVENGATVVVEDSPCFTSSQSESESSTEPTRETGERKKTVDIDFDSVSDSPIKTFRKIGQLDNCLIDFSNQFKKSDNLKRKRGKIKTGKKRKHTVKKKSKAGRKQSTTKR